ncbi:uncharacterized protein LOC135162433 [Diachasmimorpha longicaudata]|uniref:uncharacterized protein LOC135162433 n=1 Tax=Diachasmimorpha longicaudata TaxID=58733 RepID=UPI0030B8A8B5
MIFTSEIAPIFTLALGFTLYISCGEAVICYECNSRFDPRCGDPFDPYGLGIVNCSLQPRLEHMSSLEPTVCRKISQKVYGKIRVVRSCGYLTDERDNAACVRRAGTHEVFAWYCGCTTDLCNSAPTNIPQFNIFCVLAIALALMIN